MKFLVLAAFVAASSAAGLRAPAAGLRASADDFESLEAWYSFEGKGECVAKAISNSTDELLKRSDEVLKVLKKHSAFTEIVGEIEYVRDTFLEKLEIFAEETRDVNIMRLAQKVMENLPDFLQLSVRAAALTARFHLIPAKLATKETAELCTEAYGPISRFGSLAGDLATEIKECI